MAYFAEAVRIICIGILAKTGSSWKYSMNGESKTESTATAWTSASLIRIIYQVWKQATALSNYMKFYERNINYNSFTFIVNDCIGPTRRQQFEDITTKPEILSCYVWMLF